MKQKNIDYWEKVIKDTPESYKKWFQKEKEYLEINIKKDSKVLDVGCGEGRSLRDIIHITKNLTGLDHDQTAIKKAKECFKNHPEVKFVLNSAEDMPFEDNYFDHVICMGTPANFGDKKHKIFSEMKRVVKKEGSIIISLFSENAFEERMKVYEKFKSPIERVEGTTVFFSDSLGDGDNISEQFSNRDIKKICKKAGLKMEEIKKLNIAYICKLTK